MVIAWVSEIHCPTGITMATRGDGYKKWSKPVCARTVIPIHSFISWFLIHKRLPVRTKMARFVGQRIQMNYAIYETEEEDINHLFFSCRWAKELW